MAKCTAPLAALLLALGLAGCETVAGGESRTGSGWFTGTGVAKMDDLTAGKEHFRAQNYGLAETHFRAAVEARPDDAEAWLGLAASYDKLRRFDLADRSYSELERLTGPSPEFLNNRGYSYMLRGDHKRARADLDAALARDPHNERARNNLKSLETARRGARA